jgi:hypothetical protein
MKGVATKSAALRIVHGTYILMGSCALLLLVSEAHISPEIAVCSALADRLTSVALLLLSSEPNQQTANSRRQVAETLCELAPSERTGHAITEYIRSHKNSHTKSYTSIITSMHVQLPCAQCFAWDKAFQ